MKHDNISIKINEGVFINPFKDTKEKGWMAIVQYDSPEWIHTLKTFAVVDIMNLGKILREIEEYIYSDEMFDLVNLIDNENKKRASMYKENIK